MSRSGGNKQTNLLDFFGGGRKPATPSSAAASASTSSSSSSPSSPLPAASGEKRKRSPFSAGSLLSPSSSSSSAAEPPKKRPVNLRPQVEHLIASLREPSWRRALANEFTESYFVQLAKFLESERSTKTIYPPPEHVFSQLNLCPFDKVEVVILGQDPYHGPGQAHGLAFSVALGVTQPPSLKNVFKELVNDTEIDFSMPDHGNLEKWARQGVLMLNAVLTVEARKPNSHAGKGWERFTDAIIRAINDKREGVVFMLWGKYAQDKGKIINKKKHHVLIAAHPSPLAGNKFQGCKHFSKANSLISQRTLTGETRAPIEWRLDSMDVERENQRQWLEEREAEWEQQEEKEKAEALALAEGEQQPNQDSAPDSLATHENHTNRREESGGEKEE